MINLIPLCPNLDYITVPLGARRWLIRDVDSRLNTREALAVEEWIASGLNFHAMRDHPNQHKQMMASPLSAGMIGGVRRSVPEMETLARAFPDKASYSGDQTFLARHVLPRIIAARQLYMHDSYECNRSSPGASRYCGFPCAANGFPSPRPADLQHVGQVFTGDGRVKRSDFLSIWLKRKYGHRDCPSSRALSQIGRHVDAGVSRASSLR